MKVIKKNGVAVDFNPNKILNRIKKSSEGLNVNSDEIFLNVTQGIYDNITTKQLDELISNTASTFIPDNYDYSILSGRLLISRLHKEIPKDFLKVTKNLYKLDRIDKQYYDKCLLWGTEIEKYIDYDLDYNLDFFALGRFISVYLLSNKKTNEVFELPQHLFIRIAINRSNTLEDAIEDYLQLREFVSPATPIMLNSGTHIGQLASCELHSLNDDSREGIQISRNKSENASSKAAGIGLSIHNLRSKETELSTGGKAGGLIKFAKMINESMRFFDQGGNRPGACALYLEPWHKDIFDFLDLRKELGADEIRAKDIFLGLWTPDLFMKAVKEDKEWYLFCPNDIKKNNLRPLYELYGDEFEVEYNKAVELGIGKKIQAIDLWIKIYDSCVETGMPYIMYKDACNIKSNHKNIGTLKLSNLCIYSEAIIKIKLNGIKEVLTIETLFELFKDKNNKIEVLSYNEDDNIDEYRTLINAVLTKNNAICYKITDDITGKFIICTPDHELYTQRGWIKAKDLLKSDNLKIFK